MVANGGLFLFVFFSRRILILRLCAHTYESIFITTFLNGFLIMFCSRDSLESGRKLSILPIYETGCRPSNRPFFGHSNNIGSFLGFRAVL